MIIIYCIEDEYYIEDGTYNIFCGEQILKCDV